MRDFCLSGQGLARDWFVPIPGSLQIPSCGGRPWLSALPLSSSARHSQRKKPDDHTSVIGLLKTTTACVAHRGSYLTKLFQSSYKGLIMDLYDYMRIAMGLRGNKTKRAIAKGAPNADIQAPVDCILGADGRQIAAETATSRRGQGQRICAKAMALKAWRLFGMASQHPETNECKPGYPCANRAAARNTC